MNKKVWAMYFSGTGNTEKIVTFIASKLADFYNVDYNKYDFTYPNVRKSVKKFDENDIVVFGVPTIAGRVPNVLLKYLDTIVGNEAIAIPIVTFGNRNYDNALIELRDILINDGFKTVAAGAFSGVHSFSKILGKGRPDNLDFEVAEKFAKKIYDKIMTNNINVNVEVKGEKDHGQYYTPRDSEGNPVNILKVKPKTNEKCVDCKLCVALCPMGSIDYDNVKEINGICIKCCACVKKCPVEAKYFDDENYLYHQHELELQYMRRFDAEIFV